MFYQHVYDKGGAEDTVAIARVLDAKARPELEAVDEREPRADGPGAARARRTGKRRRRRRGRPQLAMASCSESERRDGAVPVLI
jgi:hypothetical protein